MALFGLIDANNFFVSCERIFRPDLHNKPVAVLSSNDGCFVARSNEVKALSIPMGAPLFKYQQIIERNHVTIFSSNFALYGNISARFMSLVESLVPRLEVYSVDEAFIDFTGISSLYEVAFSVRQQVLQSLSIPTCIGISKTKTLAKVANHLAKKIPYYNGICILESDSDIKEALKWVEINDLWGIGRRLTARLKEFGIRTAYDLQQVDPRWMRWHFTVVGERLVNELNGVTCLSLEEVSDPKKSIQVTRSFSQNITSFEELRETIASYATRLGTKLRKHNLKTAHVIVYIKTNPHNHPHVFYQKSYMVQLPIAINDDTNLIKACSKGLKNIYKQGCSYKKAGVMALDLTPATKQQYSLFEFDKISNVKTDHISIILDKLNKKYGTGTVHMAACGNKLAWKSRQEKKSPAFTTSWKELPIVFAK